MGDLEDRKIFVGGLSGDTTDEDLQNHFGQYGAIEHYEIKKDQHNMNRSKGFGFVTFVEDSSVEKVLAAGSQNIGGRNVDTKRATKKKSYEPEKPKKCFLGAVPNSTEEEEVMQHFEQFGEIEEVIFPIDKSTQKRRGFAFVKYKDASSVEKAVASTTPIYFSGSDSKAIDVKPATPREQEGGRGFGGGFGGRGGGYGGGRDRRGGGYGGGYGGGGGYDGGYGGGYGGSGGGGYGNGYDSYGQGSGGYSSGGYGGSGGYGSGGYGSGGGGGGYNSYGSGGGGGYGQSSYGGGGDYSSGYGKARGQRRQGGGRGRPY